MTQITALFPLLHLEKFNFPLDGAWRFENTRWHPDRCRRRWLWLFWWQWRLDSGLLRKLVALGTPWLLWKLLWKLLWWLWRLESGLLWKLLWKQLGTPWLLGFLCRNCRLLFCSGGGGVLRSLLVPLKLLSLFFHNFLEDFAPALFLAALFFFV